MPNYNKLVIIGHLTRTPELSTAKSGKQYCKTGIAYNNREKKASFFDVVAFGKTAELLAGNFEKGDAVGFEGEINIDQWQAQDGTKRITPTIMVHNIIFLGGGGAGQGGGQRQQQPRRDANMGNGPSGGYAQDLPDDGYEPPY